MFVAAIACLHLHPIHCGRAVGKLIHSNIHWHSKGEYWMLVYYFRSMFLSFAVSIWSNRTSIVKNVWFEYRVTDLRLEPSSVCCDFSIFFFIRRQFFFFACRWFGPLVKYSVEVLKRFVLFFLRNSNQKTAEKWRSTEHNRFSCRRRAANRRLFNFVYFCIVHTNPVRRPLCDIPRRAMMRRAQANIYGYGIFVSRES